MAFQRIFSTSSRRAGIAESGVSSVCEPVEQLKAHPACLFNDAVNLPLSCQASINLFWKERIEANRRLDLDKRQPGIRLLDGTGPAIQSQPGAEHLPHI